MSSVLKQEKRERETLRASAPRKGSWTLLQKLERAETEYRLGRCRRYRQTQARSAAHPAASAAERPAQACPAPGSAVPRPRRAPRVSGADGAAQLSAARASAPAAVASAPVAREQTGRREMRAGRTGTAPAGSVGQASLKDALSETLRHVRRRWHHIVGEKKATRFPESNRLPIQLLLFAWGMLPMLGDRIRERTWGRRRQAISRFGRARTWAERKKLHPAAFLGIAGAVAAFALFSSLYTFGTTVSYDGQVIACVASETAAREACSDIERIVRTTRDQSYTIDAKLLQYSSGLKLRREVVDETALESGLSDQIGLVTDAYALYVNGEMIGATPYAGALEELLTQLKEGVTDANTTSCSFQEDVQIKHEFVPSESIMNLGYLAEMLYSTKTAEVTYTVQKGDTWSQIAESHGTTSAGLLAMNPGYDINRLSIGEVLTLSAAVPYLTLTVTQRERYVENVPYDITYTDSAYLYKGDYKVLSAGKYGSADVVANVTYINGEETTRQVLSSVTLVNPVTEQQARGTKARPTWLPTGTFRWPCSGNITSRFGYRNLSYSYASTYHKGIDIANRRGTAVYAADGGTVVYSGWMSGYGYLVQINHGNGYVTYYGHNSKLLVKVGQHVYKGQQIAKMGSTGNSTGNHCHFEVRYNGVAKNPLNYLP